MPSFSQIKRQGWQLQRNASQGAALTLKAGAGEYTATFECATKCANVLGDGNLFDIGDGILEVIPSYKIPSEDIYSALQKLSMRFSVALVEYAMTSKGGQYVCIWRINPTNAQLPSTPSRNLDDY